MHLTDFLGKDYGPGDLVVYGAMSGRSVNVVLGRVVDIYRVYRDPEEFGWTKLADDAPVPTKTSWKGEVSDCDTAIRVKVQPLRAARWKQHHGRKRYIDTRTGKGIDPDRGKGLPHVLKDSHYVYADGTEFDWAGAKAVWEARLTAYSRERSFEYHYFRKHHHVNYGEPGTFRHEPIGNERELEQLWWVSRQYQPWVQEVRNGPEPVTLEITDNIVKWEGELPGEVPVQVP